jgi:hypothetical protein
MAITISLHAESYASVSLRMLREAAARPPEAPPPTMLRCPWCSETILPEVARLAGWIRATLDGAEVRFSSKSCLLLYNRRAPSLAKPLASLLPEAVPKARTWLDTPLVPNIERRPPAKLTCARRCGTSIEIHQTRAAGEDWTPDILQHAVDVRGWVRGANGQGVYCSVQCSGLLRPEPPAVVPVLEIPDAHYLRSLAASREARAPSTARERELAGREVVALDRPLSRKVPR